MANALAPQKTMTLGEGGAALVFGALALLAIVIAAKAYTPEYAFHAYLFTAASVAAVFAIINRYYNRPAETAPLEFDGKPNYNMGPVKFSAVASVIWGIAGFTVGLIIALQLAFPALNLDLPWTKDELREYPDLKPREQLYRMYKDIMINQATPWVEISGNNEQRLQKAIDAVDILLKN